MKRLISYPAQSVRPVWVWSALLLVVLLITGCSTESETWPGVSQAPDGTGVVMAYDQVVTSLDNDGSRRWTYKYDGAKFYAPALITEDFVYVGDFNGRFHAIRQEDGQAEWVYEFERASFLGLFSFGSNDRVIAPAEVGDGMVFFGTERGVFAVRNGEGQAEIVWEFTAMQQSVWAKPLYIDDPALVEEPLLIVAALDKKIYALNPETGQTVWTLELEGAVPAQPTLDRDNEVIYAGTLNSLLYAIDLTGEVQATYQTEGWVWGNPTIHDEVLYFGDLNGSLYALTYADGEFEEQWRVRLGEHALRPSPVIVGDTLVISSEDKKVIAVNLADQAIRWTNDGLDAKVLSNLVTTEVDGEPVVIMGTDEKDRILVALRISDGNRVWDYEYNDD